ncbi:PqqD family peptide modification chaperone [Pseudomonadota bacterium]
MNAQHVPQLNSNFRLEEFDNERILYHPAQPQAIYLNETAALVLGLCDNARSIEEIVELLREVFPESESLETDVKATLGELSGYGVVRIS